MERRWRQARRLLTSTTLPAKRIAIDLGFNDLSHFNKFVRQRSGKSPRKVRMEATDHPA
jgi:transcriptional regulator GlxA family with amidase domain